MENEIIQQEDLLDKLLEFLNTDQQLNPLMASFFANSLFSIFSKFTEQMITYFNKKENFFDFLIKHLNSLAILDFLIKLTTNEGIEASFHAPVYKWLNTQNIVKKIVNVFRTQADQNTLENASNFLIHLIQRSRLGVIHIEEEKKFYQFITTTSTDSEQILDELVEIFSKYKQSAIHVLRIFIQIADYENHFRMVTDIKSKLLSLDGVLNNTPERVLFSMEYSIGNSVSYEYLISVKNLHKAILNNLHHLKQLLIDSVPDYSVNTSFGLIKKPLGFLRLEIVHFIYALLNANNPEMNEAIANANILETIIVIFLPFFFLITLQLIFFLIFNRIYFSNTNSTVSYIIM